MRIADFCRAVRRLINPVIAVAAVLLPASSQAATITLTFFTASTYSPNSAVMDTTLGITGYTIDTFEQTSFIAGLSMTLSGGVPTTTLTSLPALLDESACGALSAAAWDGSHYASNMTTNQFSNCNLPANIANLTTFDYAPGAASFGIGLANFQSTSPPSPQFPITNHELFINGVSQGVLEVLAGANWSSGIMRNAYLRIDITGGTINSVGFRNLSDGQQDFLAFDHLAVLPSPPDTASVPEPGSMVLLASGVAGLAARLRRRRP